MPDPQSTIRNPQPSSAGPSLALAAALLGWLFDGAEMGVFSLVGRPALRELLVDADEARVKLWFGVITAGFLVGAATGGVLFGWLGDRLGRVKAMSLSVLVYALFTGMCGLARTAEELAALRFIAALGMGGEWSLGVALVMEVWPNERRAFLAGLIGAAANVGYLLVAVIGLMLLQVVAEFSALLASVGMPDNWITALTANQGWRLMMVLGTAPAALTFLIRLFVPESEKWQAEQNRGASSNWVTRDLWGVAAGGLSGVGIIVLWAAPELPMAVRIAGTPLLLAVAAFGYTLPAVRYLRRASNEPAAPTVRRMLLAAGLAGVALLGTWASLQWAPTWADQLTGGKQPEAKAWTQIWSSNGAILGTILAALLGDWIGRRKAYALMCVASFGSILLLYQGNTAYGPGLLASVFVAAFCTASFYGWLPLYLPELFRTGVRATGQGFGFNFGRILAAVGALQTGTLFQGGYPPACSLMSLIYIVGLVLIRFAPETRGQPLPE